MSKERNLSCIDCGWKPLAVWEKEAILSGEECCPDCGGALVESPHQNND